jgi:hypothetical protein
METIALYQWKSAIALPTGGKWKKLPLETRAQSSPSLGLKSF